MTRSFDEILDECMDRINQGASIEDCLASYPENIGELEPLLRTMIETQTAYRFTPSPTAKMATKQRFNAALAELARKREERGPFFSWVLQWSRPLAVTAVVLVTALVGYYGLRPTLFPAESILEPDSISEQTGVTTQESRLAAGELNPQANFRLLISDEVNAMDLFEHVHVTISGIGVHQKGEDGVWYEFELDPEDDLDGDGEPGVDLKPLEGDNALEIWSGELESGNYTKVFIHVDNVTGILIGGEIADVKLPSQKLQITKPFTISDHVVDFVYDITVVQTGKGDRFNLKPQIGKSGADQPFNEVGSKGESGESGEQAGDTTAPVIDVSGVADEGVYTEPVTPVIEVTDDTDLDPDVTIELNGEAFVSGTEISEIGTYVLVVEAEDESKNEAEVTIEFEISE